MFRQEFGFFFFSLFQNEPEGLVLKEEVTNTSCCLAQTQMFLYIQMSPLQDLDACCVFL